MEQTVVVFTKPAYANAVTHDRAFHSNEVLSAVLLANINDGLIRLARVSSLDASIADDAIIFDIGNGEFCPDGSLKRYNDIPYSSAGLIWKKFGVKYLEDNGYEKAEVLWLLMDIELFQPIDALCSGYKPIADYKNNAFSIEHIINLFNETSNNDEAFCEAFKFMDMIFELSLKHCLAKLQELL